MRALFFNKLQKKIAATLLAFCALFFAQGQNAVLQSYSGSLSEQQLTQLELLLARETTKRVRVVTINKAAFSYPIVVFQPFDDITISLQSQDIGPTGIDMPSWTGREMSTLSSGSFVFYGNKISGHVAGLTGNFELFPMGTDGIHAIVEHETGNFAGCGNDGEVQHNRPKHNKFRDHRNDLEEVPVDRDGNPIIPSGFNGDPGSPESGIECFVRVLVGFTDLAQTATQNQFGRTMIEHVSLAVLESNQGYANSNVEMRMELAHLYNTPDDETNNACDDNDAQNDPNDGRWDELYTLRNTFDADMCCIITGGLYATNASCNPNGGLCGRAFGFDYTDPDNMFQVTEFGCATGNYTFAHEFGHNQGCRHDNDNTGSPFSYARGYNQGSFFRTIMAVCCSPGRINWWSNPDINVVFNATNYATGTSDRDNARALDAGDNTVSHHQTTPGTKSSSASLGNDEYGSVFGENQVNSTNVAESGSQLDIKSIGPIYLLPGHNSKQGSVMRAYQTSTCPGSSYAKTDNTALATADLPLQRNMLVYPNPFNATFTVVMDVDPGAQLTMYLSDPSGRLLEMYIDGKQIVSGKLDTQIDAVNLAVGMYYLIVETDGKKVVQKLVKSQ